MQNVGKTLPAILPSPGRWLERLIGTAEESRAERLLRVLTLAVLGLGLWLRTRGVLVGTILPLWHDEAQWALFLQTEPLTELFIRPIAFMALTKALVALVGSTEWVLRFLPWLGGVATLIAAPALARRLCSSSSARFFIVCAFALHPAAIDLARDFKPYSVGLAVHLAVLIFALDYIAERKNRDLYLALGSGAAGVLFAQDIVFLYPALFLGLGFTALRAKQPLQFRVILVAAFGTIALVLVQYALIWSKIEAGSERDYWGRRYDVFYMADSGRDSSYAHWLARKTGDVLAMPGMRREHWESREPRDTPLPLHATIDRWLWIALAALGSVALVRRKRRYEALLLFGPLLVLLGFNLLGRWPYGSFRTNLFLLAYVTPLAAYAFELKLLATSLLSPLPGLLLVVLPFFSLNKHSHTFKETFSTSSYFPDAIQRLLDVQAKDRPHKREHLVLDTLSCASWKYYTRYHPRFEARREEIGDRFKARCGKSTRKLLRRARAKAQDGDRIWAIATGDKQRGELDWRLPGMRIISHTRLGDEHIVVGVERR